MVAGWLLVVALSHGGGKEPAEPDGRRVVDPSWSADEVWKGRCGACHKADGTGSASKHVTDLTSAAWQGKHSDADVRKSIEDGIGGTKMRAFKGKMSDEQLTGIVEKIRAMKK